MKLSMLHEYLVTHSAAYDFYGDPKGKKGKQISSTDDSSFLVGGSADRDRFLSKMGLTKNRKKKRDK